MKTKLTLILGLLTAALGLPAFAQEPVFTYQGRLDDNGVPANGVYDFRFSVYNGSETTATAALSVSEVTGVATSNGLFTVQLPAPVWVFNGERRWLAVEVRTNATGELTLLSPWTEITPTPYAVRALAVSSNAFAAGFAGPVAFTNSLNTFVGTFSGDGGAMSNVAATTLGGLSASNFWKLGGNAATTPGTHFLGTTDNQALELQVNNQRGLRLEYPTAGTVPNLIGGFSGNSVGAGTRGAVIAGGGTSGGSENTIGLNASYSAIGGGDENNLNSEQTTIAGGSGNRIGTNSGQSTIGGGLANNIEDNSFSATISGGARNNIQTNSADSTIGGGFYNIIASHSSYTIVAGGLYNYIGTNADHSTISGGWGNSISSDTSYAVIAGGRSNAIGAAASGSAVGGGWSNSIAYYSSYATIAGGYGNHISTNARLSTVGGGWGNRISGDNLYAVIAGGHSNAIGEAASGSAIGGGFSNKVADEAFYATIPGGSENEIGATADFAFAAGRRAKANHYGAFVWGDSQIADVASTASDQVTFRAQNGLRLTEDAGDAKTIRIGDRYRDNALLAWGKVAADGTLFAAFGVSSVTNHSAGVYEIFLTDTAATIHSLIPIAIAEVDGAPASAAAARIVSIDQNSSTASRFRVYINTGNYTLVNNDFVFLVTAR